MMEMINKKRNRKGFTLIELVVVIAILGVLAALAVPRLSGTQDSAKVKADVANAKLIGNAAEVALAEGKIAKGDNDTTVQTALVGPNKYIQTYPKPKYKGTDFAVTVDSDGLIEVKNGTEILYPTPSPVPVDSY